MDSGTLLAAGIIWTSRVHRSRYLAHVVVAPASRRQGIGRAMMSALADVRASSLPLTCGGDTDSTELAFADALGARTIQVVPPRTVLTADAGLIHSGVSAVDGTAVGLGEVGRAWVDVYRWTHESWAPVIADAEAALVSDLEIDIDLAHSRFVRGEDGRITAGAFVFTSGSGWEIRSRTRSSTGSADPTCGGDWPIARYRCTSSPRLTTSARPGPSRSSPNSFRGAGSRRCRVFRTTSGPPIPRCGSRPSPRPARLGDRVPTCSTRGCIRATSPAAVSVSHGPRTCRRSTSGRRR